MKTFFGELFACLLGVCIGFGPGATYGYGKRSDEMGTCMVYGDAPRPICRTCK